MTDAIDIAQKTLLSPVGLEQSQLEQLLGDLMGPAIDYGDIYLQSEHSESWMIEDSIIKNGSFHISKGVGLRAISGEQVGFAHCDEFMMPALLQAARSARSIANQGQTKSQAILAPQKTSPMLYQPQNPLNSVSAEEKTSWLQAIDTYLKKKDPRVDDVIASMAASYEVVYILASDGTLAADCRPMVRINIQVIVSEDDKREVGYAGMGGRVGFDTFSEESRLSLADEALRIALVNLHAKNAPAGTMPLVLGPGWPGVLLHEAVGHGLEGDFNRRQTSAFSGRIGEQVASPLCTVVDNGAIPDRRGSLNIDDEGTLTQETVLIENGILKGYMQDKLNARLMGQEPTGNGRRESYASTVMPRMTNTYLKAGTHEPEDMIKSIDKGLYAVNFAGGQVDITSGQFVFSSQEAYMIENGRITYPVKGATIIGRGPDVMGKISMVGHDFKLDRGIGVCGKEGHSVPVGVGQPSLKIDEITIGGTE